jgi:hypothetical protein
LGDGVPALELPTDRPRPTARSLRGGAVYFELDAETTRRLKELARASGATLYMVLMAAFQSLFYRYSGQEDFAVGTPTSGRSRAALSTACAPSAHSPTTSRSGSALRIIRKPARMSC